MVCCLFVLATPVTYLSVSHRNVRSRGRKHMLRNVTRKLMNIFLVLAKVLVDVASECSELCDQPIYLLCA
jgi:hypothetical protein